MQGTTYFRLDQASAPRGGAIHLVLYWTANARLRVNYTVFTHLADPTAHPVAQNDAEPQNRAYPTSVWQAGEEVEDPHTIDIPAATPPGQYQLVVGLYDHTTGIRVPLNRARSSDSLDSIRLSTITIE